MKTMVFNTVEQKPQAEPIKKKEAVNHPSHYNCGRFEVIDVIEDWNLDFNKGNAVKYIGRAGHKDPNKEIEDLEKAIWYLQREVRLLKLKPRSEKSE